jgi:DNA-binding transcriptional MerR regulator
MPVLDIAAVSRRSGLPASTLRFYEEKGLIASIGRGACGARSTRGCSSGSR